MVGKVTQVPSGLALDLFDGKCVKKANYCTGIMMVTASELCMHCKEYSVQSGVFERHTCIDMGLKALLNTYKMILRACRSPYSFKNAFTFGLDLRKAV
jgi:hypothetical protein